MIFGWFGKGRRAEQARLADADQLALDLLRSDWKCSCCGEIHHGIMELAAGWPDPWGNDADERQPNALIDMEGDFLSSDFCVIGGESFLVRAILEIPVHGLDRPWAYGCWTTLARENFERYVAHFDESYETDETWFGWLCNRLRIYNMGDEPLAVTVLPQPDRQRPKLCVEDETHPLGKAQREGIAPDELLALFRAYGHGPTEQ